MKIGCAHVSGGGMAMEKMDGKEIGMHGDWMLVGGMGYRRWRGRADDAAPANCMEFRWEKVQ